MIKAQVLAIEGMMNVYIQWLIVIKIFCFIIFGKTGFLWWPSVATARYTGQQMSVEWHAVGPQPAFKTFEGVLIVFLGSIVVRSGCFCIRILPFLNKAYFCLCLTMMLSWCCVTKNIEISLFFLLFYLSY